MSLEQWLAAGLIGGVSAVLVKLVDLISIRSKAKADQNKADTDSAALMVTTRLELDQKAQQALIDDLSEYLRLMRSEVVAMREEAARDRAECAVTVNELKEHVRNCDEQLAESRAEVFQLKQRLGMT